MIIAILIITLFLLWGSYVWFFLCVGKAHDDNRNNNPRPTYMNMNWGRSNICNDEWKKENNFFEKTERPFMILGCIVLGIMFFPLLPLVLPIYFANKGKPSLWDGSYRNIDEPEPEFMPPIVAWDKRPPSNYDGYEDIMREFEKRK